MFKAFEFCPPTLGKSVPTTPEWLHEVKYDGYRLRLERDGDRVWRRLDWSSYWAFLLDAFAAHNRSCDEYRSISLDVLGK